ncbi:MAG: TonB-dependent receptor domain-containing protein [Gemmatimonadaceae bacterium]
MRIRFVSGMFAVLGLLLFTATAEAQTGTVSGRVTAQESGTPVVAAQVRVMRGQSEVARGVSDEGGNYRIVNVPVGTYAVMFNRIGFLQATVERVAVTADGTTTADATMSDAASLLNPVVVTRGAAGMKVTEAPISISVINEQRIEERPAVTITDHLKSTPGLSISNGGIVQANIVSRGFNNAFSTSMMMLQDYRFAGVPSLRVNVPFLFTGTGEDIERIEVLQGPASALYGPNSGAGVIHVLTKSPFSSQGTTLTVDGGERSLLRVGGRHAGVLSEKLGYKLSGEYFTAKDWEYNDPNETVVPDWSAVDPRVPASRQGQVKVRDFDLLKYSGEARIDYRPSENTEFITTAGYSQIGSALEITTTFGAAQVKNWSYSNLQQRFRHKNFFAQVFYNASNAGNDDALDDNGTFYLRSGIPVVDKSNVLVGQMQQTYDWRSTKLTGGLDYIATTPKTAGTIMGRNENDDKINEFGGYLQVTQPLTEKLDFTGAVRGDMNSRIEGTQFSPRLAFVYKAAADQNFRFTFNRAFNSPASFSFFLDQWSGVRQNLGPVLGTTDVQIFGNPSKKGWVYDRGCDPTINGGLCMRSPLAGPNPVAATGANLFPGAMQVFAPALAGAVAQGFGLTPTQQNNITAALQGLTPTDAQLPGVLRNLGVPGTPIVPFSSVTDFAPLGADFSNTWELGYKGLFGGKFRVAVDYWYQIRPAEPTTQVINLDDALFMSPGTPTTPGLITYLGSTMGGVLVANGVPAAAVPTVIGGWVAQMAAVPGGMLNFDNPLYDKNYLVFTYQSATGQVDVHGVDFAADYALTDVVTIEGTYSNLARNVFTKAPGASAANPLTANAPKHRATLTVRYSNDTQGLSGEVRGRYMDAFDVSSGVYNNYGIQTPVPYDRVPVNAFLDLGVSYKLPIAQNVRIGLNAQNILDNRVPSFIGVPEVGRMVTTRLQYSF